MKPLGNAPNIAAFGFKYGASVTVDINSEKVFKGVAFSWSKRFDIAASDTVYIVVDPTLMAANETPVVLPVSFTAFGAGPINIDLYVGTTFTAATGTVWEGGNRDHNIVTAPKPIVTFDPTITLEGIKTPFEFMVPSDGVPAVASFGGQAKDDLIFIARKDAKYAFKLINTEANEANCLFAMTIFEAIEGM